MIHFRGSKLCHNVNPFLKGSTQEEIIYILKGTKPFQDGSSVVVPYVCSSVVSYVEFVLSFFIPHLSFFGAPGNPCLMCVCVF